VLLHELVGVTPSCLVLGLMAQVIFPVFMLVVMHGSVCWLGFRPQVALR
jgi:hypothetical protein